MNFHVWNCTIAEVVEKKLVFVMKYRSLPFGKGEGGMGFKSVTVVNNVDVV